MGIPYQRGMLLYNQKRYGMAADEFRKELAVNPQSALAMGMLALSLNYDRKPAEAMGPARDAIACDPDRGFVHYVMACVMIGPPIRWTEMKVFGGIRIMGRLWPYRRRLRKAKKPAMEAIRLDPHNVDFLALMSAIELDLRHYRQCLEWAEKGLAIRPNHVRCTNLRARALAKLGRANEARQTVQGALALDPESASTHYHGGWTHLQTGDPAKAVEHFRESVRLNPNDQSAHNGLKAAQKAAMRKKYSGLGIAAYLGYLVIRYGMTGSATGDPSSQSLSLGAVILAGLAIWGVVFYFRRRKS